MFRMALALAAQALILMLMMDIGIAVLSRAMPRLQIFFVALPLKLFVGIVALVISLQLFQPLYIVMFAGFQEFLIAILNSIRG